MLLKNKTNMFGKVADKVVRPWRDVTVPDGTDYDKNKFEEIGKVVKPLIIKKEEKTNKINKGD